MQGWEFAHSLIAHLLISSFRSNQMSDCERFAQIAQDKWAIVSESLRSFRGNERQWAICSGRSEEMSDVNESLISLTKNEWMSESLILLSESLIRSFFDKKSSDSLGNQMSEFPSLKFVHCDKDFQTCETVKMTVTQDWLIVTSDISKQG